MSFFSAIGDAFARYAVFDGVSSRTQFWFWILFATIALCTALVIDGAYLGPVWSTFMGQEGVMAFDQDAGQPLTLVLLLILILPTISVAVRRMHDVGFSGWWLLGALTLVGLLPLAVLLIKGRKKSNNRFAVQD